MIRRDISSEEAIAIADQAHRGQRQDLSARCAGAFKITEQPPEGMYQYWRDEPAWYVWFLPEPWALASSYVIVVSKRTGQIIGNGSAGDEG
jgi:hypothetical protein